MVMLVLFCFASWKKKRGGGIPRTFPHVLYFYIKLAFLWIFYVCGCTLAAGLSSQIVLNAMRLSQMALAFPFVLSQIIVDGLAYNVGMSKDCNENDDLMISRNNAAPTPSQPREFGCPEQQFKNSTAGLTVLQQRSDGVQHCHSASQCPFHCGLCCLHYLNDPVSASCEVLVVP